MDQPRSADLERIYAISDLIQQERHDQAIHDLLLYIDEYPEHAIYVERVARSLRHNGKIDLATLYYSKACLPTLINNRRARTYLNERERMSILYWSGVIDFPQDSHVGHYQTWVDARIDSPYEDYFSKDMEKHIERFNNGSYRESPGYSTEYALKSLLRAFQERRHPDTFRVCDIGGYLGWYGIQLRERIGGAANVQWTVVERPVFANAANDRVRSDWLSFVSDIGQVLDREFDVLFLSNVLQVLECPETTLDTVGRMNADSCIIEGFPASSMEKDFATIYYHSRHALPVWVFSEKKWMGLFSERFLVVDGRRYVKETFDVTTDDRKLITLCAPIGLHLKRRRAP